MSYRRRHRRLRRVALGLAFASAVYAGSVSAAPSDDPYRTDIYVRSGESLGGPDGGPAATSSALGPRLARSETDAQMDEQQFRIEHALEAQSQGGLSGYLMEVADGLVASEAQAALTKANSPMDDQQLRIEQPLEADAQAGLSGYLEDRQVWMEGVSDAAAAAPAEG